METHHDSRKRTARFAGLLYLIWVFTGIFGVMYVPAKTIVRGDAAATAIKILENEFLFRTNILNDIVSNLLWVIIVFVLYRLLRTVSENQAKLMVALVLVQVPTVFFMEAFNISSLMLFKGELLKTFDVSQRQDLAMLLLRINDYGTIVLEMFWGLWLFPFGYLVYRSNFIPRILGVFLLLNGIAYVLHSFTSLLYPEYKTLVGQIAIPFWTVGEISISLWLLIKGVKTEETV